MNARDAAVIACRLLAVYIVFEALNIHTRTFYLANMNPNSQPNDFQLLVIPVFVLIGIYLWWDGGKRISRLLANPDEDIQTALNAQQWVCLILSLMGFYFLVSSITSISNNLFVLVSRAANTSQFANANPLGNWYVFSLLSGLSLPFLGLMLLIFSWPLSKAIVYLQTFQYSDQKASSTLTTQALALSLLGIYLISRVLPQIIQYISVIYMNPQQNQSTFTFLSVGAWVQLCFALALTLGARGIIGMLYMLRVWGNPFAKESIEK